jgi:hypothetical protein
MKTTSILITIALLVSCRTSEVVAPLNIAGKYAGYLGGDGYWSNCQYRLTINSDSSFSYEFLCGEVGGDGKGHYIYLGDRTILLIFPESHNVLDVVSRGYMGGKQIEVDILDRNRLKMKNVILTRQP